MHLFAVLAVKHALPCYHVYELDFFFSWHRPLHIIACCSRSPQSSVTWRDGWEIVILKRDSEIHEYLKTKNPTLTFLPSSGGRETSLRASFWLFAGRNICANTHSLAALDSLTPKHLIWTSNRSMAAGTPQKFQQPGMCVHMSGVCW